MIDVEHHHFGGAARGAARLDGAGGAVADLEEAHQARRFAAAGQTLVLGAECREIGAGAGAIFEQAGFAHPQIHDAAVIDQIVGDGLDEAGVRLGMLVGRGRAGQRPGDRIAVIVALAGAVDAIGPMQAGIEPLRAVGSPHLAAQHRAHFVIEAFGVGFLGEIAALPAPIGPGAGQAMEDLARRALAGRFLRRVGRLLALQPGGHALFLHGDQIGVLIDAGAAEIFLRQHVARHLRPVGGNLDVGMREHHRAVGILDLAGGGAELDAVIGRGGPVGREMARDLHGRCNPPTGYGCVRRHLAR